MVKNKMKKIMIFGGTVEGRLLAEYLTKRNADAHISVAGKYAADLLPYHESLKIHTGRMDKRQMTEYMKKYGFDIIVDATHPYASEVTENIKKACECLNLRYMRLKRDISTDIDAVFFDDIIKAAEYIKQKQGPVFITTGSKEIKEFTSCGLDTKRMYVRILPDTDPIEVCRSAGIKKNHIICMQGPFDADMNQATMRHILREWKKENNGSDVSDASLILVTKQSGRAGGFDEKIEAAKTVGAEAVVIGRTEESDGLPFEEVVRELDHIIEGDRNKALLTSRCEQDRHVWMIGLGMCRSHLTLEAVSALNDCEVVIGAKRMIESVRPYCKGKKLICSCNYPEIASFIKGSERYRKFAALFSGDIGFHSGCASLRRCLKDTAFIEHVCSGISAPVHFLNRIGVASDDCAFFSMHGHKLDPVNLISRNRKSLFLLGKENDISDICEKLIEYDLPDVRVVIGCDLMSEDELIEEGTPASFTDRKFSSLSVIYIENRHAEKQRTVWGIPDHEFLRGNIPMTKSAVRSVVMSKLAPDKDSVVFDIGAGTGSVSVEAALCMPYGKVFSVECEQEGIDLININSRRFHLDNIVPVHGIAPEVFSCASEEISKVKATHAFIGGTKGRLSDIVRALIDMNPEIKIVITAVTPETIGRIMNIIDEYEPVECDLSQIQVSISKKAGKSHLMQAQNPVFIAVMQGFKKDGRL